MALYVASINSGSNGNCYYVGTATEAVLVDAGISCREIERRMSRLGLTLQAVKAIFVSHEHSDHIRGLYVLSRKHNIPVYINEATQKAGRLSIPPPLVRDLAAGSSFSIGELTVNSFSKHHDAADPCSFTISGHGVTVGVFTDIGSVCHRLVQHFGQCHAAFLEANYDEEMLDTGPYPPHLKKRIKSDKGHLSNLQALELFRHHRAPHLSHLFLSHLSKENNRPELVQALFSAHALHTRVSVASRYGESELFFITSTGVSEDQQLPKRFTAKRISVKNKSDQGLQQMSLF